MKITNMFDDSFKKFHIIEVFLIRMSGISQKLLNSKCLFRMDDVRGELQVGKMFYHFILCFPVEAIRKNLEYVEWSMIDIDGIGNIGQSTQSLYFNLFACDSRDVFGH